VGGLSGGGDCLVGTGACAQPEPAIRAAATAAVTRYFMHPSRGLSAMALEALRPWVTTELPHDRQSPLPSKPRPRHRPEKGHGEGRAPQPVYHRRERRRGQDKVVPHDC